MARMSKSDSEEQVHTRLMREFDVVAMATYDERLQSLQDRRFAAIAGAQYEGPLSEQFKNKPRFEVSKIPKSLRRIYNDMRGHRIDVLFNPRDDDATGQQRELADAVAGVYRADKQDSNAAEAEDNAFDEAVAGGIGAYRLCTEYVDDDDDSDERQRIKWEAIHDADSCVYFDLGSKRMDKSDARLCWVLHPMTWDAYEAEYDDSPSSWPRPVNQSYFDWSTTDTVFVAEVYEVETKKRTVTTFEMIDGSEERYDDDQLKSYDGDMMLRDLLEAKGAREVRSKKTKKKRVRKWLMNGQRIIKDCGYVSGPNIPVVMVYGNRAVIDGVERAFGHVRHVKDAQRLKNMAMSKIAEIASVSSTRKPIFTPAQVQGHEAIWRDANIEERAYMTLNPVIGPDGQEQPVGPIGFTEQPDIPPALAALVQMSDADMNDILGNQGGADQLMSNVSNQAVESIQERIDEQTFLYVSNLGKAMRRAAEIYLGIAREVYDESGRMMKSIGEDDETGTVVLQKPTVSDDGVRMMANDMTTADLDVVVTIGPSSASKRKAVVSQATALLSVAPDPETQKVLTAYIMMNLEGEGMGDLNRFARQSLVRLGVVEPTDAEKEDMMREAQAASQKPQDPQAQLLQAAAMEAAAKAEKAKAEVLETFADTELKRAQTQKVKVESIGMLRGGGTPRR